MVDIAGVRTIYRHYFDCHSLIKVRENKNNRLEIEVVYSDWVIKKYNIGLVKGHVVVLYPGIDPNTEPTVEMILNIKKESRSRLLLAIKNIWSKIKKICDL